MRKLQFRLFESKPSKYQPSTGPLSNQVFVAPYGDDPIELKQFFKGSLVNLRQFSRPIIQHPLPMKQATLACCWFGYQPFLPEQLAQFHQPYLLSVVVWLRA